MVLECALAQELKRVKGLNSLPRSLNVDALCDGVNTVDLLVRCSSLTLIRIAFICCPLSSTSCEVKDLRLAFDKDLFYTAFSWSFYAARKIFLYARLQ